MSNGRIPELEQMFTMFPGVPREVVVKEDILRLGIKFTPPAVAEADRRGAQKKTYARLFAYTRIKPIQDMDQVEAFGAPEHWYLKGGPYGLRRTLVRTRSSPVTPYVIDVANDGQLSLFVDGQPLALVEPLSPLPQYYSKTFDDGTRYCDVVPLISYMPFITAFMSCQFWGPKEECRFCDINENYRQMRASGKYTLTTPVRPVDKVATVMEAIFREATSPEWPTSRPRPSSYFVTGGAIVGQLGGKSGEDFYLDYIRAIKDRIGSRWPCKLETVAADKKTARRFKEAGVDMWEPNLEVWDKELFRIICPGKEKSVGRDKWIANLIEAVDVFGEGNVTTNMVLGVEMAQPFGFTDVAAAVASTAEGLDYIMFHGVVPRFTTWFVNAGSALRDNEPAPLEYYVRVLQSFYEIWSKYNLPLPGGLGPMGPGRSIMGNSAQMDMDLIS